MQFKKNNSIGKGRLFGQLYLVHHTDYDSIFIKKNILIEFLRKAKVNKKDNLQPTKINSLLLI